MSKEIHAKLVEFGKEILYKTSLAEGLPHISKYAKEITGSDRCSMYIYDSKKSELWTTLADGIDRIIVPYDKGIAGETLRTGKAIIENDVTSNPNFLSKIDSITGYKTNNLATVPIFNSHKDVVGVLQLLNKDDGFNEDDIKYMTFFAHSLSEFIDLINLYEKND
ncbi:GAF domain-containing protein [Sulfurimonas sp.]|nr:GAF domain-containing protein [Sulfurimonas sp.]